MQRREFVQSLLGLSFGLASAFRTANSSQKEAGKGELEMQDRRCDVAIIGGGLGGCAAALSAAALGRKVILTEETDWLGGQLTAQAVPPDEHPWIEHFGCTRRYRQLRNLIRQIYRDHYPLLPSSPSDPYLNPGKGYVSRLCCEPKVALIALNLMLAYPQAKGNLLILLKRKPIAADVDGDFVKSVTMRNLETGSEETIYAEYFLDATELGDLLPLTGTEYVTGAESKDETGEPHAKPEPQPANMQAITWVFAMSYDPKGNHVIEKPEGYEFWRDYVPQLSPPWTGKLLDWTHPHPITLEPRKRVLFPEEGEGDLWRYRRIICKDHYLPDAMPFETTIVNWPQNDYWLRPILPELCSNTSEVDIALREARQLSLSLLYWLQTEAPRPDGGTGYPGLFLRPDITGTDDGLAKFPYIRESRRIKAVFTVTELHVGVEARKMMGKEGAERFYDSIGIGCYRIDLHPSTGGDNYIDISAYPFQIPLGALLPIRMRNLLPACKNISTTHIANGCFRLHPVEWNIGEVAGMLAAFCLERKIALHRVREQEDLLHEFQNLLRGQGVELEWARVRPV